MPHCYWSTVCLAVEVAVVAVRVGLIVAAFAESTAAIGTDSVS